MSEDPGIAASEEPRLDPSALRDAEDNLNPLWLDQLRAAIEAENADELARLTADLHASDIGDVLGAIEPEQRVRLVSLLGDRFDFASLTEVDDQVRTDLIEDLPPEDVARGVATLDSDDAVYILEDIDYPEREAILAQLPAFERLSLKRSLDFPEDSAGRLMQTDFIAIPPFWTVGQTIDYLRDEKELPDEFFQIYVVDPSYNLLGTIPLDKFLRSKRTVRIEDLMNRNVLTVDATEDQEEAARDFERYDLIEIGVLDENKRLVGVLTVDDMVDVIHEEATEDIQRLAGVGDEEISDNVWSSVRSRISWLVVNLFTAILSSLVIGLFNATIEQMVALAILMPIVASLGGNAGNQSMTVTVRALAMRELPRSRIVRVIFREIAVGLVNGVILAILIGLLTAFRFSNTTLGLVIASAMVVNMIVAGAAGILIPLTLHRLRVDPAVASSIFVTAITDVVGFFAFLGLAGLWFGLF